MPITSAARRASLAVLDRAAAPRPRAVRRRVARQRQVDARHVVAGLDRAGGRDRGVDAAGHRGDAPSRRLTASRRAGPLDARPIAATHRVDVGLGGGAGPGRSAASCGRRPRRGPSPAARARAAGTPAEQAEPVEHSMPRASSSISRESPSQPGKPRWALPGSRAAARSSGAPLRTASGTAASDAGDQPVAQQRRPGRRARPVLDRQLDRGGERRRSRAVSRVPLRMSRSWPPPCTSGVTPSSRRTTQRAHAERAADLVAGEGQRVDAGGGEVDRHGADRLDGVGVDRDAVLGGERDDLLDRLQGADLVVGPHHRDQRDRAGLALDGGAQRVEVERGPRRRRAAARPRRPRPRPASRAGPARRGAPPRWSARGRRRGSAARRDQKMPLSARLSASVPPEVNTTSPGRQPSGLGDGLARLLDHPPGARGPRRAASWGCRRRRRCAVIASTAAGTMGVVAAWSR